nr:ribonuclease H-like domain-containing protein [Tanacetum cinerariifolium]
MILTTLDNLGKFEAKGNEGYFIRYSMSSKAFRVFNKRTKRVEENLHAEFLKNKWMQAHDALLESTSSKLYEESGSQVPKGSGNPNPTASAFNPLADQMETLTVESPIPT